jgi:NADH:ubiquinone oxidoreductase subunit B-like Fe-S oxidoreductase
VGGRGGRGLKRGRFGGCRRYSEREENIIVVEGVGERRMWRGEGLQPRWNQRI